VDRASVGTISQRATHRKDFPMKLVAILAGATLLGGGAVASGAVDVPSPSLSTRTVAAQQGKVERADRPSRDERLEIRKELRERTLKELGLTPEKMLAARKEAIATMVADELITQEQADKMIERMEKRAECMQDAEDPRECRPRFHHRGGRDGGPFGGKGPDGHAGRGGSEVAPASTEAGPDDAEELLI
jgi:hypothetical protein